MVKVFYKLCLPVLMPVHILIWSFIQFLLYISKSYLSETGRFLKPSSWSDENTQSWQKNVQLFIKINPDLFLLYYVCLIWTLLIFLPQKLLVDIFLCSLGFWWTINCWICSLYAAFQESMTNTLPSSSPLQKEDLIWHGKPYTIEVYTIELGFTLRLSPQKIKYWVLPKLKD